MNGFEKRLLDTEGFRVNGIAGGLRNWLVCQFKRHDFMVVSWRADNGKLYERLLCRRCARKVPAHPVLESIAEIVRDEQGRVISVTVNHSR